MTIIKDLLYNRDNQHLEIARLCSFMAVVGFLVLTGFLVYNGEAPSLSEYGIGWGGVAGGSAGWIYMRQKVEHNYVELDNRYQSEGMGYNRGGYYRSGPYYGGDFQDRRYDGRQFRGGPDRTGGNPTRRDDYSDGGFE